MNQKLLKSHTILAICILILSVIPVVAIGPYLHQFADDYVFGAPVYKAWTATHSFGACIQAALGRIHAYLPDMAGYLFGMFPDGITTRNFWQILACTDYSIGKSNSFHLYTGIHNITQIATYQQIGIHFHFYSICINDRTVRMVVLRCILLV